MLQSNDGTPLSRKILTRKLSSHVMPHDPEILRRTFPYQNALELAMVPPHVGQGSSNSWVTLAVEPRKQRAMLSCKILTGKVPGHMIAHDFEILRCSFR